MRLPPISILLFLSRLHNRSTQSRFALSQYLNRANRPRYGSAAAKVELALQDSGARTCSRLHNVASIAPRTPQRGSRARADLAAKCIRSFVFWLESLARAERTGS